LKKVSILNHVIGPIMRGPSSSHTAGPWRIGMIARDLLGSLPLKARFTMHPSSSLSVCYHDQGSDLALVSGLLRIPLTDSRFSEMLKLAPGMGLKALFEIAPFPEADHPNSILVELEGEGGGKLVLHARSVGGGSIEIASVDGCPLAIKGDRHVLLVELDLQKALPGVLEALRGWDQGVCEKTVDSRLFLFASCCEKPPLTLLEDIRAMEGITQVRHSSPVMFPLKGVGLFVDTDSLLALSREHGWSLGETAMAYEKEILGFSSEDLSAEMDHRLDIMLKSVATGFGLQGGMKLLRPSARSLMNAEASGSLIVGGPHFRAAARAMAAMHTNGAGGVVCAAPTGGSAGVIPGVLSTLIDDFSLNREGALKALWAAGAIGLALDRRSTFAAEVCGCQVEIGAAGAMGAAAVVEAAGGTALEACDAAATVFQNIMGSVCDLVQGIVEIPCHSRNAALASMAFLCADMVMGGYRNPVPLDETIDAVDSVGRMLPEELRCTARGGLSLCPAAQAMPRLDRQ